MLCIQCQAWRWRQGVAGLSSDALRGEYVDRRVVEHFRQQLDSKADGRILRDTRSAIGWIYDVIKQIAKVATDEYSCTATQPAVYGYSGIQGIRADCC